MNKKAEMRLQHIIIAILVMSLFGVFMFNLTSTFITEHSNITESELTDGGREGNQSNFFKSINKISNMSSELIGASKSTPGGSESAVSSSETDSEGSIVKSGYKFIANIGNWVYKYPKEMIYAFTGFMGLPEQFSTIAFTILIVVVGIILISSILKNKL